ncbi:Uncharacterised protein [Mycobacteroides abscessus subsp. abscessus]|nr:Uncharacterised protein [Mycobacteroides abscessus subsp. abscessus]
MDERDRPVDVQARRHCEQGLLRDERTLGVAAGRHPATDTAGRGRPDHPRAQPRGVHPGTDGPHGAPDAAAGDIGRPYREEIGAPAGPQSGVEEHHVGRRDLDQNLAGRGYGIG